LGLIQQFAAGALHTSTPLGLIQQLDGIGGGTTQALKNTIGTANKRISFNFFFITSLPSLIKLITVRYTAPILPTMPTTIITRTSITRCQTSHK
jgi:hypothetical protein